MRAHRKIAMSIGFLVSSFHLVAQQTSHDASSAWRDGRFQVDVAGVIGRSDIVLDRPNEDSTQALPIGNGRLGVAVWSGEGFTAQLNRSDTMPLRLSPGQVVVPGLAVLATADDYHGRLDFYNGEFRESGGGMTAVAYVPPDTDTLIIDVTGARLDQSQTAKLRLWKPRSPKAVINSRVGLLSEVWKDDKAAYASGREFGTLAALTAEGLDVAAAVTDPWTITVSFKPFSDGHFRILVASPHWDGTQNPQTTAKKALSFSLPSLHRAWWNSFWSRAAMIKITSPDGAGEYMENLRNIDLYVTAIGKGEEFLGYHAGVADMISSAGDERSWDPSAYWHWDMRQQIAADVGAGLADLNTPYFKLYRDNLPTILNWTKQHMGGHPGACVPETMRFNGRGYETADWLPKPEVNCGEGSEPYYNARTISTGAEVSLWIWQQYLATDDREFLVENYPIMAASARFLLDYQKPGPDGLLHTEPSNAHETQWDVADPTTDLAAIRTLFPATVEAAKVLNTDSALVAQLQSAVAKVPPFPRADPADSSALLPTSADADGRDVIAISYRPAAEMHNIENIGLEPVWPYGLIGDSSPMLELARRTYAHRPFVCQADWSFDPIQAARLGLGREVSKTLIEITKKYQKRINGLAQWIPPKSRQFFVEQVAVVADALQEALVQDYDGLIRIAPAAPPDWDIDGSVYVRGITKVDVQIHKGTVTTLVIEAGTAGQLRLRNPWPQDSIDIVSGTTGAKIEKSIAGQIVTFPVRAGEHYLIEPEGRSVAEQPFVPVSGVPAKSPKKLGDVQIGLFEKNL